MAIDRANIGIAGWFNLRSLVAQVHETCLYRCIYNESIQTFGVFRCRGLKSLGKIMKSRLKEKYEKGGEQLTP